MRKLKISCDSMRKTDRVNLNPICCYLQEKLVILVKIVIL